jgi:choline dehydrogenase
VNSDPRDGLALGGYTNLINMDPQGRKRSYAATAYWLPAAARSNLDVLTGALVERILFEKKSEGKPVATGVRYSTNGETTEAKAGREVILCAGSFGSPQILELSGIGDPEILGKYGIDVVVANENVGENLQDHAYVPIG